jgi:hypothetical protein
MIMIIAVAMAMAMAVAVAVAVSLFPQVQAHATIMLMEPRVVVARSKRLPQRRSPELAPALGGYRSADQKAVAVAVAVARERPKKSKAAVAVPALAETKKTDSKKMKAH